MNNSEVKKRLKEIVNEDRIWIIYLGIIILSYISNYYESKYFLNNDLISKEKYKQIVTIIFAILVVVYLYFLKSSVDDLLNLKNTDSIRKKRLVYLSFIASLFIAISGFIYLYISLVDDNLDIELAFN